MQIFVKDRNGVVRVMSVEPGDNLMRALVANGYDIEAICGGVANCATCHVFVGEPWIGKLQEPEYDEEELIEASEHRRPGSRLSCQIEVSGRRRRDDGRDRSARTLKES